MSWGAVIGAGAALIGGAMSKKGSDKAAKAAQAGGDAAIAEQRRQYDQTREDNLPWLTAGTNALERQQQILDGNYTGFYQSPDYVAALEQGTRQLDAGAAARGNLWGGGADADRIRFGQNMATQNLGNYWNRLGGLSGTGSQTATSMGQFGQAMSGNVGNMMMGNANTRASAYMANGNNWSNVAGQLGNVAGQWLGNRGNG